MAAAPPAEHDPQAQRAHAGTWLGRYWKEILAVAVAVVPVGAYFLLRGQSSNAAPSGAVLPGLSGGGSSAGDFVQAASDAASTVQEWTAQVRQSGPAPWWDPTHRGVPTYDVLPTEGGHYSLLTTIPFGADVQVLGTGVGVPNQSGATTWYKVAWGGVTGWVTDLDLANFTGGPVPPAPPQSTAPAAVFAGL